MRALVLLLAAVTTQGVPGGAVAQAPPGEAPAAAAAEPPRDPASAPTAGRGVLTRPPELVELVPAEYPPDAEAAGIEGAVMLSIVIGEDGEVRQAVVLDPGPHPGFAAAALHAIQRFRFRPAEIDGAPAAVEITYRYDFVLKRAAPTPPPEAPVALEGRVIERGTRSPIAGVAVEAGGATAETDADGRFALRGLPPGTSKVRVVSPEHERLEVDERIAAGKRLTVEYRLTRRHYDPYEAVVRGAPARREVSVETLAPEEVRTLPGTQGDVLKVLQDLPGVARSPFGIGLLVVRGSDPQDSVVEIDGVEVPLIYHFGGITSVVSSDVVEGIDFYPGNFASHFGRALGGAVEIRTREPKPEWHGAAQVDVYDGRVEVDGPVGEGSAFVSVRRSWVDAVLAVALPRIAPDQASDLRVAPRYYDYQAKLSYPLLGGTGSVMAFGSDDALEYIQSTDLSGRPTFSLHTLFHRLAARWRGAIGPVTNDVVLSGGTDSIDVVQASNFGVLTEFRTLALRDDSSLRISEALTLAAGLDLRLRTYDYSVYAPPSQPPGQLGAFSGAGGSTVGEQAHGGWWSPGAWVEARWHPFPRLLLVPGLRLDGDSRLGGRGTWLDPRLTAFLDVTPRTTLTAGAGLYSAAPPIQDTTALFGNPGLGPQRALHLSLGVKQALPGSARAEVTGFYKKMWQLVVPTRATDAQGDLLHLSGAGLGEAIGVEVLVRRELAQGLFGWIAYTWSRALRRDDPTLPPWPAWHPFAFDQTHVLALVASYRFPGDVILGARVRAVTGNPYTPEEGHVLDADTGRYQCLLSSNVDSGRLPAFFQADARIDKRWVFDRWMLAAYLDVQNVTNRQNAEYRFPNYDCTQTVPIPSLPVLPALGLRAEW